METNIQKSRNCELSVDDIVIIAGNNPRQEFEEQSLFELGESIKNISQLQPVIVNLVDNKYILIAGERRVRAHQKAGKKFIEAKVFEDLDELTALRMMLAENRNRVKLNVIEEARGMQKLLEHKISEQEVAAEYGIKAVDTVRRRVNLLKLCGEVQDMITREHFPLPVHQAQQLVKLKPGDQLRIARMAAPITGPIATEDQVREAVEALSGQKSLPMDHADEDDKHPSLTPGQKKRLENKKGTLPPVPGAKTANIIPVTERFGPFDVTIGIKGKLETSRIDGEVVLNKVILTLNINNEVQMFNCEQMPLAFDNDGKTLAELLKFLKKVQAKKNKAKEEKASAKSAKKAVKGKAGKKAAKTEESETE